MNKYFLLSFYAFCIILFSFVFYKMYSHSLSHDFYRAPIIVRSVITSLGIFAIPFIIQRLTSKKETNRK